MTCIVESSKFYVDGATDRGSTRGPILNRSYIGLDCFGSWKTLCSLAHFERSEVRLMLMLMLMRMLLLLLMLMLILMLILMLYASERVI